MDTKITWEVQDIFSVNFWWSLHICFVLISKIFSQGSQHKSSMLVAWWGGHLLRTAAAILPQRLTNPNHMHMYKCCSACSFVGNVFVFRYNPTIWEIKIAERVVWKNSSFTDEKLTMCLWQETSAWSVAAYISFDITWSSFQSILIGTLKLTPKLCLLSPWSVTHDKSCL